MESKSPRVLVIGLDGADFRVIDPLIAQGRLPHLASLMSTGTRGPLRSSLMPNSFPAWASLTTGANPGKHGIFWSLVRTEGAAYPLRLMSSRDIRAKRLWEILSAEGFGSGVVNVPTEYPPSDLKGFMVSGALAPGTDCEFTFPATLRDEILAAVPGYRCEVDYADVDLERLASQILESIDNREKLVLHLMEKKTWDLFFAVFTETDLAQHKFWAGIDPNHPDHRRLVRRFGAFVHDVYQRLDESVGRMIGRVPEEDYVLIVSDHGFGPFYQSFSLPRWLEHNGYLALKRPAPWALAKSLLARTLGPRGSRWIKRLLAPLMAPARDRRTVRSLRERDEASSASGVRRILWSRTRAYFTADYGVRLNLRGREPEGIVAPGEEANALLNEMAGKLNGLSYSNGQPVFEAVLVKEDAFSGPSVPAAPDLIVPVNHAQAPASPERWEFVLTHPTLTGTHAPRGVLLARGPGIKRGAMIDGAGIMDVTPTILSLFGAPLTEDMDGTVLLDLFTPEARAGLRIVRKGSSLKPMAGEDVYSEEEQRQIQERLRDLGYIE